MATRTSGSKTARSRARTNTSGGTSCGFTQTAPAQTPSRSAFQAGTMAGRQGRSSKKRKLDSGGRTLGETADEESGHVAEASMPTTPTKKKKSSKANPSPCEKRAKRFRPHPPQTYLDRLERAQTQRMFLLDRKIEDSREHPKASFDLAGTTGNVYTVKISTTSSCTCPDSIKNNQCKHIIYVMVNVLKARSELQYQLALLPSELREIFNDAPLPAEALGDANDEPGERKPVEGDCPICMLEMEASEDGKKDDLVWCKAGCGNNVHKQCFEQWAASKPGEEVRCVYCRTPWIGDEESVKRIYKGRKKNNEGYVNVAAELGISGERDYSTYHRPWVEGRFGYGY